MWWSLLAYRWRTSNPRVALPDAQTLGRRECTQSSPAHWCCMLYTLSDGAPPNHQSKGCSLAVVAKHVRKNAVESLNESVALGVVGSYPAFLNPQDATDLT